MRSALVAILFVLAQAAPGLHAALEADHDTLHVCCPDGSKSEHLETCAQDHEHAECPVCTAGRAPLTSGVDPAELAVELDEAPASPEPVTCPVDPFHVEIPDSRGPPA